MRNSVERSAILHRIPPCPDYDTETTCAWLEDMASRGCFLDKNGFCWGLAFFRTGEPRQVRYQADPLDRKKGDRSDLPAIQKRTMYADFGWTYTARRGTYYYYRCDDPTAPDLNSDPDIQATGLRVLETQEWSSLASWFFWLVVHFYLFGLKGAVLMIPVVLGLPFFIILVLLDLVILGSIVTRAWYLHRYRRKLTGHLPLRRSVPDPARKWRYWLGRGLDQILLAAFCLSLVLMWGQRSTPEDTIALETYEGDLPFATLADLFPEGEVRYNRPDFGSTLSFSSTALAPAMISLREYGDINVNGSNQTFAILFVDYYETLSPWMAREIAREMHRMDWGRNWQNFTDLQAPALDADYAAAYDTDLMTTMVLACGNRAVKIAYFSQEDNSAAPNDRQIQAGNDFLNICKGKTDVRR